MISIKVVASLNFFGQGNYCTKNLCAMCTGTKADFSQCTLRKKCYWIYNISAKSMHIIDSKQYVTELAAYVSVLFEYFFGSIIYMLLAEIL